MYVIQNILLKNFDLQNNYYYDAVHEKLGIVFVAQKHA